MPQFNTYTNMVDADVADDDEIGIWDTSAAEFKNMTMTEVIDYVSANSTAVPDGTVDGHTLVWDHPNTEWDESSSIRHVDAAVSGKDVFIQSSSEAGTGGFRFTNSLVGIIPVISAESPIGTPAAVSFQGDSITFESTAGTYSMGNMSDVSAPSVVLDFIARTDVATNSNELTFKRSRHNASIFIDGALQDQDVIMKMLFKGSSGGAFVGFNETYGEINVKYLTGDLTELNIDVDVVKIGGLELLKLDPVVKVVAFNAFAGYRYLVDTTTTAFTATFPTTPTVGDQIQIIDVGGNLTSNTITLGISGEKFYGVAENMDINDNYSSFTYMYLSSAQGWQAI